MYLGLCDNGITLGTLAAYCGGTLCRCENSEKLICGVSIDSRDIRCGNVFFAIKGDRFDGHDFVSQAEKSGACCAVVSRIPDGSIPYILVGDTREALGAFSHAYKRLFNVITLAVTGSVGKTTTKQYIYSILDTRYKTHKTEGNFNNDIGLPLTLLSLNASYKMMVVEMGMSARGEISALSKLAEPDISVITNIGNSHIEMLGSRENIRDAKLEITDGMKDGAILILNGDEPLLTGASCDKKLCRIYFGIDNPCCDYRAENVISDGEYIHFDVRSAEGESLSGLSVRGIGRHNVYDALAAVVCGILLGINDDDIRRGLLEFKPAAMRQNIIKKDGFTVIEDCYNAGPESMAAAIETLSGLAKGGRIAVLGDMRELGAYSAELHRGIGQRAAQAGTDVLVTIGKEAENIADGALSAGMKSEDIIRIKDYSDAQCAANIIKGIIREGDTVLIKASRALSLERVSNLL